MLLTIQLTGLLLKPNKCAFPQLQQHVSNLQGDSRDLLAKSHHYCQTNVVQDITQQVLAQKPHFRDSSSQNHNMRKTQHRCRNRT